MGEFGFLCCPSVYIGVRNGAGVRAGGEVRHVKSQLILQKFSSLSPVTECKRHLVGKDDRTWSPNELRKGTSIT